MCKRQAGEKLLEEEKGLEGLIDDIGEDHAKLILDRLELLSKLREIVNHPKLEERLRMCENNLDTPDWWESGKHDRELVRAVLKYGLYRSDQYILNDTEFPFAESERHYVKSLEVLKSFKFDNPADLFKLAMGELPKSSKIETETSPPKKPAEVEVEKEVEKLEEAEEKEAPKDVIIEEADKVEETPKEIEEAPKSPPKSPKEVIEEEKLEEPTKEESPAEVVEEKKSPEEEKEEEKMEVDVTPAVETEKMEVDEASVEKPEEKVSSEEKEEPKVEEPSTEKEPEEEKEPEVVKEDIKEDVEPTVEEEKSMETEDKPLALEKPESPLALVQEDRKEDTEESKIEATPEKDSEKSEVTCEPKEVTKTIPDVSPIKVKEEPFERPEGEIKIIDTVVIDDDDTMPEKQAEPTTSNKADELRARFPDLEVFQPLMKLKQLDAMLLKGDVKDNLKSLSRVFDTSMVVKWFRDFALEKRISHIIYCVEKGAWPVGKSYSAYSGCLGIDLDLPLYETVKRINTLDDKRSNSGTPDIITITTDHHQLGKSGLSAALQSQLHQSMNAMAAKGKKGQKRHIAIDVETERAKLHALLNNSSPLGGGKSNWNEDDQEIVRRSGGSGLQPPPAHQPNTRAAHANYKPTVTIPGTSSTLTPIDLSSR